MDVRHQFAEFFGTCLLVFSFTSTNGDAFATAAALFVAYAITGLVSGGHFNPAVSIGYGFAKIVNKSQDKTEMCKWTMYIVSQLVGGLIGALLAWALTDFTHEIVTSASANTGQVLLGEILITAILVAMTIVIAEIPGSELVGTLGAPIVTFIGIKAVGPVCGGAFNPALGIMTNLVHVLDEGEGADLTDVWFWIVGPVIGGIIGALIFSAMKNAVQQAYGVHDNYQSLNK
jgi:glycerol uptake facilitator-like aquaporin